MRFVTLVGLVFACGAAWAEDLKVHPLRNAAVYTKIKYNLVNRWQHETGLSHTVASLGRWSLSGNLGYTQTYDQVFKDTGWNFGVTVNFKLDSRYTAYSKVSTAFLGPWRGEHGLRATLYRGLGYSVALNAGYVHAIPFRSSHKPAWTSTLTLTVPLKTLGVR